MWKPPLPSALIPSFFSWGLNSRAQLGHSGTENQASPRSVNFSKEVVAIAAGWGHSLALTDTGHVYAWGAGKDGELGFPISVETEAEPREVPGVSDIIGLAAGGEHSLALTSDGRVISWGDGRKGQLGLTGNKETNTRPRVIETLSTLHIVAVSCGLHFSAALSDQGEIYLWGEEQNDVPTKLQTNIKATTIACANGHCILLTENGDVYVWGKNADGELGLGKHHQVLTQPQKLPELSSIIAIAVGQFHSLALTELGEVYSWGWNIYGQTGTGIHGSVYTPTKVDNLSNVIGVYCGSTHSLALTADGNLFMWGGWNASASSTIPREVPPFTENALCWPTHVMATINGRVTVGMLLRLWRKIRLLWIARKDHACLFSQLPTELIHLLQTHILLV